ncbi:hypothetical protein JCM8208_007533 [Rhodotorula glutinis]
MPAADGLTARAFTSSVVLNPPSSRLYVRPDVLRALRAYRTAVLRALGPSSEAERVWAEQQDARLVQQPIDMARRALGLGTSSSSTTLPLDLPSPSPASPSSPHTPLPRLSTSPIPSPLRLRAPSTVTRFYAALFDHPIPPPGTRTPPLVSRAYDDLWAAAREAVTADVWDEMCRMRRGDESCAKLALEALKAAKEAVVGRPPGRSIDARVQQIKAAQGTIVDELVVR